VFKSIAYPELFFGLVAPIGVNLETTATELARSLERHGYTVRIIKVTDIFSTIGGINVKVQKKPLIKRYNTYIRFGNEVRKKYNDDSVLAALAISWIAARRHRNPDGSPADE
jgi:hypothetical protein